MTTIKLSVQKTSISAIVDGKLTSGMVGVEVLIDYDSSWDELTKTATFRVGDFARSRENIGTATTVPWEVMRHPGKVLMVGVEGKDVDGNIVMPTVWVSAGTIQSGANATIPAAPNPENGETPSASGATIDDSVVSKSKTWSSQKISEEIDVGTKADAIVRNISGETISILDSSDDKVRGLKIFGKTTQDGTPTPDTPVELVSVGADRIVVGVEGTGQSPQTIVVQTPNGLPGIPVSSGGNYTDADGQQWICDEIDFGRGVYVQRVKRFELAVADMNNSEDYPGWKDVEGLRECAEHLTGIPNINWPRLINIGGYVNVNVSGTNEILFLIPVASGGLSQSEWKANYPDLIVDIMLPLEEEVETPLSAEEIAKFKKLHTNYPNTTVHNDAGAYMELVYNADTKTYVDNGISSVPGGGQSYVLPIATTDTLGGVKPNAKTDEMTQSVGVDAEGGLWTVPGGSGSGGGNELPFINKLVTTEEVTYIEISTDANGNAFDITEIEMFVHIPDGIKAITVDVFANQTAVPYGKLQAKTDGSNVFHLKTNRTPNWQTMKTGAYGSPQYDTGWSDVVKYVKEPAHITSVGIANWSSITIPVGTILEVYGR